MAVVVFPLIEKVVVAVVTATAVVRMGMEGVQFASLRYGTLLLLLQLLSRR